MKGTQTHIVSTGTRGFPSVENLSQQLADYVLGDFDRVTLSEGPVRCLSMSHTIDINPNGSVYASFIGIYEPLEMRS